MVLIYSRSEQAFEQLILTTTKPLSKGHSFYWNSSKILVSQIKNPQIPGLRGGGGKNARNSKKIAQLIEAAYGHIWYRVKLDQRNECPFESP